MKLLLKKGLNQIKISADPVKKKSCYKEVMVPTKARTIYRSRLLNTIQAIIISAFLLIYPLTACAGETNPVPKEGLPWGVFPLNNTEWQESTYSWWSEIKDSIDISVSHTNITTLSVRQIGENRAELYSSSKTFKTEKSTNLSTGEKVDLLDSSFTGANLIGHILIEDNKVYYLHEEKKDLMFDFNVKVGDTLDWLWKGQFHHSYNPVFYVNSIDSILVGNTEIGYEYRKQYFICNKFNAQEQYPRMHSMTIVEGIGCVSNNFFYTLRPHLNSLPEASFSGMYYRGTKVNFELVEPSNMYEWLMGGE